jgi:cephalosporin-C deacetylase
MPSIDMPLEQLRQYRPPLYRTDDFDSFWEGTIQEALAQPLNAELVPYRLQARRLQCYAVRFDGFRGGRIAGWYVRPETGENLPALCIYHGYGGRAARPLDVLHYADQGLCVLTMDCRGQNGQSQDSSAPPEGHALGWMTQGIRDRESYYYRFAYADAVRALELLARRDEVDEDRIAVMGFSQGGGLTLAAASLSQRPILALADGPFLCDFRRAIQIATAGPYPEIPNFIKAHPQLHEQVIQTLSYFDCLNLAPRVRCRTVVCSGLWDEICPPSTIFSVFHHLAPAEKQLEVYPFHGHEVPYDHQELKFRVLMETMGR